MKALIVFLFLFQNSYGQSREAMLKVLIEDQWDAEEKETPRKNRLVKMCSGRKGRNKEFCQKMYSKDKKENSLEQVGFEICLSRDSRKKNKELCRKLYSEINLKDERRSSPFSGDLELAYRSCLNGGMRRQNQAFCRKLVIQANAGVGSEDCPECRKSKSAERSSGAAGIISALAGFAGPLAMLGSNALMYKSQQKIQKGWSQAFLQGQKACLGRYDTYLAYSQAEKLNHVLPEQVKNFECNGQDLAAYAGMMGTLGSGMGGFSNPYMAAGYSPGFMSGMIGPYGTGGLAMGPWNMGPQMQFSLGGGIPGFGGSMYPGFGGGMNSGFGGGMFGGGIGRGPGVPFGGSAGISFGLGSGFGNGFGGRLGLGGSPFGGFGQNFGAGFGAGIGGGNLYGGFGGSPWSGGFSGGLIAPSMGIMPWGMGGGSYWNNTGGWSGSGNWQNNMGMLNAQNSQNSALARRYQTASMNGNISQGQRYNDYVGSAQNFSNYIGMNGSYGMGGFGRAPFSLGGIQGSFGFGGVPRIF